MSATYHTVKIAVRVYDPAAMLAAAIAQAIKEGMNEEEARNLLTTDPDEDRYEVATGLGANGDEFGVLDNEAEEIGDDRYATEAEAQAAADTLAATKVPDVNACLIMLFDPGSPDGVEIQETSTELDGFGEAADAFL